MQKNLNLLRSLSLLLYNIRNAKYVYFHHAVDSYRVVAHMSELTPALAPTVFNEDDSLGCSRERALDLLGRDFRKYHFTCLLSTGQYVPPVQRAPADLRFNLVLQGSCYKVRRLSRTVESKP